jgi:hypothetical protein
MDRIEIVVPRASGEAIFRGSHEKRVLDIGKAKMGMTGGPQIFLQKAPDQRQVLLAKSSIILEKYFKLDCILYCRYVT